MAEGTYFIGWFNVNWNLVCVSTAPDVAYESVSIRTSFPVNVYYSVSFTLREEPAGDGSTYLHFNLHLATMVLYELSCLLSVCCDVLVLLCSSPLFFSMLFPSH